VVVPVTESTFADTGKTRRFTDAVAATAESGAAAVVFSIDTAGGHPFPALREVLGRVPRADVRRIAWVNPAATGAGAAVALASDAVYVAPSGVVGALSPPVPPGDPESGELREYQREVAVIAAQARAVAAQTGHDPRLAGALADAGSAVVAGGEVLKAEGVTLALTSAEAIAPWGGGEPLADGVVADLDALLREAGLGASPVVHLDPETYREVPPAAPATAPAVEAAPGAAGPPAPVATEPAAGPAGGGGPEDSLAGKVVVIEVGEEDLVSKARFEFMRRMLARASSEGAAVVVFDLNTPGGYAWETTELMLGDMARLTVPSIAYVNPQAQSAGCLIAIACDDIYMAPSASIGSAGAVTITGEDLEGTLRQKVYSMMVSVARNTAELKGHNPDVVEAFIDEDKGW
jgi:membrane-bound ClpP family serine protease